MASNYWIKLYHEMLYDPKMGRMSDRLYRRTIELFLLAGEVNKKGYLPELEDIAFKFRADPEQLETEMIELQRLGILSIDNGEWYVTNFKRRQDPVSGADRVRLHRENKKKQQYYGTCNDSVTNGYTDTDTDTDTDTEVLQLSTIFHKETGIAPVMDDAEVFKTLVSKGVLPDEYTNAIHALQRKKYTIKGPESTVTAALNVHNQIRAEKDNGKAPATAGYTPG